MAGLDGFYDHCFDVYGAFGLLIPETSDGVCEEVYRETGLRMMIVAANDPAHELLRHFPPSPSLTVKSSILFSP